MTSTWKYIDNAIIEKSNWIDEESQLLNWADNPKFEKVPLNHINMKFLYLNPNRELVGIAKTIAELENSRLNKSIFFDNINYAKNPKQIFTGKDSDKNEWLNKKYLFDEASIYHLPIDYETVESVHKHTIADINFIKDEVKIPNSIILFHDFSEIFIIMREEPKLVEIKSILKSKTSSGKTKKVRISDDLPKEFIFSKTKPISSRKTRRINPL
jgi:hypothetical protein